MHPAIAGIIGIGTLVVVGGIVYQLGRAPNTVPVVKTVNSGVTSDLKTLYKS